MRKPGQEFDSTHRRLTENQSALLTMWLHTEASESISPFDFVVADRSEGAGHLYMVSGPLACQAGKGAMHEYQDSPCCICTRELALQR